MFMLQFKIDWGIHPDQNNSAIRRTRDAVRHLIRFTEFDDILFDDEMVTDYIQIGADGDHSGIGTVRIDASMKDNFDDRVKNRSHESKVGLENAISNSLKQILEEEYDKQLENY